MQHVSFCTQSRMQMSKNVNNDLSMNPPIVSKRYSTPFENCTLLVELSQKHTWLKVTHTVGVTWCYSLSH